MSAENVFTILDKDGFYYKVEEDDYKNKQYKTIPVSTVLNSECEINYFAKSKERKTISYIEADEYEKALIDQSKFLM